VHGSPSAQRLSTQASFQDGGSATGGRFDSAKRLRHASRFEGRVPDDGIASISEEVLSIPISRGRTETAMENGEFWDVRSTTHLHENCFVH
jgi:hypothetical protein